MGCGKTMPALLLAALLGAAGCGGQNTRTVTVTRSEPPPAAPLRAPASGPQLILAHYAPAADRACAAARKAGAELMREAGRIPTDDQLAFERLAKVYDRMVTVHERWLRRLRALRPAGDARAAAGALLVSVTARDVLVRRTRAALERRDAESVGVYTADLLRLLDQARATIARHGFRECGSATPETIAG